MWKCGFRPERVNPDLLCTVLRTAKNELTQLSPGIDDGGGEDRFQKASDDASRRMNSANVNRAVNRNLCCEQVQFPDCPSSDGNPEGSQILGSKLGGDFFGCRENAASRLGFTTVDLPKKLAAFRTVCFQRSLFMGR